MAPGRVQNRCPANGPQPAIARGPPTREPPLPAKQIAFSDAARAKIVEGVNLLADAVKVTLDPTKVTRYALQHAASTAGLIITTDVLIAALPEREPEPGAMDSTGM